MGTFRRRGLPILQTINRVGRSRRSSHTRSLRWKLDDWNMVELKTKNGTLNDLSLAPL
jgi:hypothetical protein